MANNTKDTSKEKDEMVMISKSDRDTIFQMLEDNKKTIDALVQAADKNRLAKAMDDGKSEPLIKKVRIWTLDGKPIIAWKSTQNVCEIMNGRWIEMQKTMVFFEDGDSKEMELVDFYRKTERKEAEILSKSTKTVDGKEELSYSVMFPDGKKLEINSIFVN